MARTAYFMGLIQLHSEGGMVVAACLLCLTLALARTGWEVTDIFLTGGAVAKVVFIGATTCAASCDIASNDRHRISVHVHGGSSVFDLLREQYHQSGR
jgi:hypothetical protein